MSARLFGCAALVLLALLHPSSVAIAPPFISDAELAQYPIIVAARWNKAPLEPHNLVEGNVGKELETRTELVIERVVRGDVARGTHKILLGPFIGWWEEGAIFTWTSTMMCGDVDNTTSTNLWFLREGRSWDERDKTTYLILDTYRGVQPLALEPYFRALMSKDPDSAIARALKNKEPLVVLRSIKYICGEADVWPRESRPYARPINERDPLVQHRQAVEEVLNRREPEVRREAAAVYAYLAGKESIPRMRSLLNDADPYVRGIAVGTLARYHDAESSGAISEAAKGIEDGLLGCRIIEELEGLGSLDCVPAIIAFLQSDSFAYQIGLDFGIPALKAKAALKKMTGHDFPFDVQAALAAWDTAKGLPDEEQRRAFLAETLPGGGTPVTAQVVNTDGGQRLVIANASQRRVTLTRKPASVDCSYDSGASHHGWHDTSGPASFLTLAPGEALRLAVELDEHFLAAEPATRTMTLLFARNGNELGLNAWIGTVTVFFGEKRQEPPGVLDIVEERRSDGSLSLTGQMLNGKKHGWWTYFDERGNAVRDVEYINGEVSSAVEHTGD